MNFPTKEQTEKRNKALAEAKERVRLKTDSPWTLDDLVLYQVMNALGVRSFDIPKLIRDELEKIT